MELKLSAATFVAIRTEQSGLRAYRLESTDVIVCRSNQEAHSLLSHIRRGHAASS